MANKNRLELLKTEYDFEIYRLAEELQPTLFDIDLPTDAAIDAPLTFEMVRRREAVAIRSFRENAERAIALGEEGKIPSYYETFLELLDGGFPPRLALYVAWASSPRLTRWPKTQEELASMIGLTSDRQFSKWRRKYKFIDALVTKLQAEPMLQHRADVIDALIRSASIPDYKNSPDRKLLLEITGDYVPSAKFEAELRRSSGDTQVDAHENELIDEILNPKLSGAGA